MDEPSDQDLASDEQVAPARGTRAWFKQASREEWWAYIDEVDEQWARYGLGPKRNRKKVPDPALPADASPAGREQVRRRQVNVKLTDEDHGRLQQAARKYGVRPATMAQLLVNRGVRAVLEDDG